MGPTRRSSLRSAVPPLSPNPLPSTWTEIVTGNVMRPCCPARNVSSCCRRHRQHLSLCHHIFIRGPPLPRVEGGPSSGPVCAFLGSREGGIPAMRHTHPHPKHARDWKARGFPCRPGTTTTPSLAGRWTYVRPQTTSQHSRGVGLTARQSVLRFQTDPPQSQIDLASDCLVCLSDSPEIQGQMFALVRHFEELALSHMSVGWMSAAPRALSRQAAILPVGIMHAWRETREMSWSCPKGERRGGAMQEQRGG